LTNVLTNIVPHYISPPEGIIRDLTSKNDLEAVAYIRNKLKLLHGTAQAQALPENPNELILTHLNSDRAPIPAPSDRENYAGDDHLFYWTQGLADSYFLNRLIERLLGKSAEDAITLVDFGGASGRVMRHFVTSRLNSRLLLTDIGPNNISFVRSYLSETITPIHNVIFPPLPLADKSVDFLYAFSVFTHISDFEEAWLYEIKRILRPGGAALVTLHMDRTLNALAPGNFIYDLMLRSRHSATCPKYFVPLVDEEFFAKKDFGDRLVLTNLDWPVNNCNVFHTLEYIKRRWSKILTIEEIIPKCHGGHQDGVVLRA
jgi:ubiquinone/menaquinone biosynthesis C-methylase UbiE